MIIKNISVNLVRFNMKKRNEWKPILFDGQMVVAIIEKRKNVTRRLHGVPDIKVDDDGNCFVAWKGNGSCKEWTGYEEMGKTEIIDKFCPYYVGQKLWVKETFCEHFATDDDSQNGYVYKATNCGPEPLKWKPSLFMPRKASRIDLLVTGIGLGQLGNMKQDDFLREGFNNKEEFVELWNIKNPKDKYNDYKFVWDVGFDVLEIRSRANIVSEKRTLDYKMTIETIKKIYELYNIDEDNSASGMIAATDEEIEQ